MAPSVRKNQLLIVLLGVLIAGAVPSYVVAQNCGCAAAECCSRWGYCGTGDDYCGTGCQGGPCTPAAPTNDVSVPDICLASDSSYDHHRLRVSSFLGLFGISLGVSTFALVLFYIFYRREQIARDREEAAGPGPPAHEPPARGPAAQEPPAGGPEPPARGIELPAHEPPAREPEPPARGTEPPAHEPPAIELVAQGPAAHEQPAREPEPPAQGPAADDNIQWNRKRSSSGSTKTSSISHRKSSHSY
uniref:Chitin-binding type-1 domain-containing protein n=1 Tax=Salix viminalis TaxID=40686 RepID=A0A6N2KBZ1_SALVM